MLLAIVNGIIGSTLLWAIGQRFFALSSKDALLCIGVSNLAGLFALLATLYLERNPGIFKGWLNRSARSWSLLLFLYIGVLLALIPFLRDFSVFFSLFLPLVLSTGFSLIAFGPIQDYLVRRDQKRKTHLIR